MIGSPSNETTMSPGRRPARAAGPPSITSVITTPFPPGTPNHSARSGPSWSWTVIPIQLRTTWPFSSCGATSFSIWMGMANPIPCPAGFTAALMPTTAPRASSSGPPELPGLIAASVWMKS